jgi:hypothetical protein
LLALNFFSNAVGSKSVGCSIGSFLLRQGLFLRIVGLFGATRYTHENNTVKAPPAKSEMIPALTVGVLTWKHKERLKKTASNFFITWPFGRFNKKNLLWPYYIFFCKISQWDKEKIFEYVPTDF